MVGSTTFKFFTPPKGSEEKEISVRESDLIVKGFDDTLLFNPFTGVLTDVFQLIYKSASLRSWSTWTITDIECRLCLCRHLFINQLTNVFFSF